MQELQRLLQQLDTRIAHADSFVAGISKSPVSWHIDHSLLTIKVIIDAVKNSDPAKYSPKFNMMKTLVFTLNKIPRGKAKAPKQVQPDLTHDPVVLKRHLDKVMDKLEELNGLDPKNHFPHPYFGQLNVKQTVKFLGIHTRHHLKIIDDIIRNQK
ncbi:MAG: DinB family protein [Chitinophagaceae bacterium]|nr:DinB family protein [Chitinophagaceae bacterium]